MIRFDASILLTNVVHSVACTTCNAPAGKHCVTVKARAITPEQANRPHWPRILAYMVECGVENPTMGHEAVYNGISCRVCLARPGVKCRNEHGRFTHGPHEQRRLEFIDEQIREASRARADR